MSPRAAKSSIGAASGVGAVGHLIGARHQESLDVCRSSSTRTRCAGGSAADAGAVHLCGRVAVAAVVVVHREDIGVLLDEQARQAAGRLVDIGPGERLGGVVGRLAGHAGVVVSEVLQAVDAEHANRFLLFGDASITQRLARREVVVAVRGSARTRRHDEHGACPSALARAIVPLVVIASSSGWAWKVTSV
jgi:hypothetical protein